MRSDLRLHHEDMRAKKTWLKFLPTETTPAGAGCIFNITSKLGGIQPSRYISRQEPGVLCG